MSGFEKIILLSVSLVNSQSEVACVLVNPTSHGTHPMFERDLTCVSDLPYAIMHFASDNRFRQRRGSIRPDVLAVR